MRHKLKWFWYMVIPAMLLTGNIIHADHTEKYYIVELKDEIALFDAYDSIGNGELVVMSEEELAACSDTGIVSWYEEDFEVQLFDEIATDEELYDKWDLKMIEAETVVKAGCAGRGVQVGIIDSGVANHPDLGSNILTGYNYLTKSNDVTDNIGHGTFVSGLIGATVNNVGIDGVAPECEIVPLKCFDTGYTTRVSHICAAMYDAVDNYGCDVINMSLGVGSYSKTFESAVNYAVENGVIIVAAVGNTGTEALYYPAAFDGVVGVASVDSEGERSAFSQMNESVMITAPGEYVYSTDVSGGYSTKKGTSFSAPLVSGCIAAFMNIDEELDVEKLAEIFSLCSDDKGTEGYDEEYGYGIINCKKIVGYMLGEAKCFVAPIGGNAENATIVAYNNTSSTLESIVCVGQYDERGLMKKCEITKVKIEPWNSVKLYSVIAAENMKCFVWSDIVNVDILSNCRERTEE